MLSYKWKGPVAFLKLFNKTKLYVVLYNLPNLLVSIPQTCVVKMFPEEYSQEYDPWKKYTLKAMVMFFEQTEALYEPHKGTLDIMRRG